MGHSAGGLLALTTVWSLPPNPLARLSTFTAASTCPIHVGLRRLSAFAQIPDQPEEFMAKIHQGRQAITSLPMFVDGKPAVSDPQGAWYISQVKNGTSVSSIVPDGDYLCADATARPHKGFPPTYLLHGKPDVFVDYKLSVRAYSELRGLGVECEIVIGDEIGHGFDQQIQDEEGDPLFAKYVIPAFEFIERRI
ncbi:hypothetical protein T440DRAFT_514199 [Plenodomus tracheiphilus IPT5]|uniref:Alpha/beta-hydrolase n=1 Tax=Plenodomus tracheiphilus IPT5 TaxID=1408161 RepID=A0A6A7BIN7_9PLEO|nr:hypothetical protein T440DRAFT_514199 [Plenodomus tracheiphilus IPT5]